MIYRRCGESGLKLPALSLGLWNNFGEDTPAATSRKICLAAFDLGITHFDLANTYGPPPGAAEVFLGQLLASDLAAYRDELIISTKAGRPAWPGPYGDLGSRKALLASLDRSLRNLGVDYVDIFYSHRFDPGTPLEETMAAIATAVTQGKALYAGISSYSAEQSKLAIKILRELGTPCLIHQPSYSMFNRWIESDHLLDVLAERGVGCIVFSPLAQGLLSDRYLGGLPAGSRATSGKPWWRKEFLDAEKVAAVRTLDSIAKDRNQSLAQMAIAWALRDGRVTSALVGASRPEQIQESVKALGRLDFDADELAEIDRATAGIDVNIWNDVPVDNSTGRAGGTVPLRGSV
jgi:L-glyceraldehyde 3-phosphate reductase